MSCQMISLQQVLQLVDLNELQEQLTEAESVKLNKKMKRII